MTCSISKPILLCSYQLPFWSEIPWRLRHISWIEETQVQILSIFFIICIYLQFPEVISHLFNWLTGRMLPNNALFIFAFHNGNKVGTYASLAGNQKNLLHLNEYVDKTVFSFPFPLQFLFSTSLFLHKRPVVLRLRSFYLF